MYLWSANSWVCVHEFVFTSFALVPPGTTGNVCLKFPIKRIVNPPINLSYSVKSMFCFRSQFHLCAFVQSFQTIKLQSFKICTMLLCLPILHTGVSTCDKFSSNLNAECAVFPPSSNDAAIPEEATPKAIRRSLFYFSKHKVVTYVITYVLSRS